MKKLISFKLAGKLSLIIFGLISVFHLVLILGILIFDYAPTEYLWGGRMGSVEELFYFELVSLGTGLFCFTLVAIRCGLLYIPKLLPLSKIFLWFAASLFLLNTLGNILAETIFEKYFAILTFLIFLLCVRLAMEKIETEEKH